MENTEKFKFSQAMYDAKYKRTTPLKTNRDNGVVFESTDPSKVSIDNDGIVTAHKPGVVVIKARCGEEKASCVVNVTA